MAELKPRSSPRMPMIEEDNGVLARLSMLIMYSKNTKVTISID
jgi:hypothetical protein